MSDTAESTLKSFLEELGNQMAPMEGKVAFGNLRKQVSEWEDDKGKSTNIAIIYETPGGSTNQINIAFHHFPPAYHLLNDVTGREEAIPKSDSVLNRIRDYVATIPERRCLRLRGDIDAWCQAGKSQAEVFASLNKLLSCDFKGACITTEELQEATRYAIEALRTVDGSGS
ncbi:MAG: hypothetical protein AUJ92_15720 [Armatimonadetes bacterium CG2_30_59_28]|nr:hypothetical protein [Armatimonadota bacterium]OIO91787.1 MAG: hypothetical protein AUJ92_15720 [Armatimonadetes bacterium CG2_30_59_28]PIU66616.1 MAG: hypothetical protein COS85_03995 [Armatimonadetes bacterium CG07_land_8_20_14_0_80_59_28]PIX40077.1 MAG: hypothetical protein COZ56_15680 [Armatimonadetes bacterium CG_4_8_14_3_um_filter_58_9]